MIHSENKKYIMSTTQSEDVSHNQQNALQGPDYVETTQQILMTQVEVMNQILKMRQSILLKQRKLMNKSSVLFY